MFHKYTSYINRLYQLLVALCNKLRASFASKIGHGIFGFSKEHMAINMISAIYPNLYGQMKKIYNM